MKIMTSYFYMIRFFSPWMIPLSTALSDPKWYHNHQGKTHIFFDKNRVINGIRIETLHPDDSCSNLCTGKPCKYDPATCKFLKAYHNQLKKIDFQEFIDWCERFADNCKKVFKLDHEPVLVLIVHEAPDNQCSEREMIHRWFQENNYPITEFKR